MQYILKSRFFFSLNILVYTCPSNSLKSLQLGHLKLKGQRSPFQTYEDFGTGRWRIIGIPSNFKRVAEIRRKIFFPMFVRDLFEMLPDTVSLM